MLDFIARKFIKNHEKTSDITVRSSYLTLVGIMGIINNIILFTVKLLIGVFMNSIAIISDAVNSFSDIGSSGIVVASAVAAKRRPDKEHPFGHGRMEYILTLIMSMVIMMVGWELVTASYEKIINPKPIEFSWPLIITLAASLIIKLWIYAYNKYFGKKINSNLLVATAKDSMNDVLSTSAVIVSSAAAYLLKWNIDGWIGGAVSLLIIWTGFGIAKDAIKTLIGSPPDSEVFEQVRAIILEKDGIFGVHDLVLHDYGPGHIVGTAHVEVSDTVNIVDIHEVIDKIEDEVLDKLGIAIVLHTDPISTSCAETAKARANVDKIIADYSEKLSYHDFRLTKNGGEFIVHMELAIPYGTALARQDEITREISEKIRALDCRYVPVVKPENG